jgi:hypothetical protein
MSLINDALKRANETKPPPAPAPANGAAPLKPGETQPNFEGATPPAWLMFVFPVMLLAVCGIAGLLIYKGWKGQDTGAITVSAREPAAPETTAPASSSPATPPTVAPASTNTTTSVASTEPAPTTSSELKLQGVFYRPSKPSAVINGKTVYRGDKVENARVISIGKRSVTVQVNGETKVLTLE